MAWWVIPLLIITSAAISYAISYSMAEDFSSHSEGGKLDDLAVQTSTYGKAIPILYGTIRFAGNVIWSTNIAEHVNTSSQTSGGKGGGGGSSTATQTTYSYSVSLAIALCEGEIDSINNIWADAVEVDLSTLNITVYNGTESQLPDPFIESMEGIGTTPAYRGLAYVVIQDFWLGNYGNRIPNFTFEARRILRNESEEELQDKITEMILIPGSGEFVYDTNLNYKTVTTLTGSEELSSESINTTKKEVINCHNYNSISDCVLALNNLNETCKNITWISPTVNWFVNSTNAGEHPIIPKVELTASSTYENLRYTYPNVWEVSNWNRRNAERVKHLNDIYYNLTYGGTPDDESFVSMLSYCKNELGYNIMIYPMLLVDQISPTVKPWRGRITANTTNDVNCTIPFSRGLCYNKTNNKPKGGKLWEKFCMEAPRLRLRSEKKYLNLKRA
jgi:hypothetical protein